MMTLFIVYYLQYDICYARMCILNFEYMALHFSLLVLYYYLSQCFNYNNYNNNIYKFVCN